ncbi:unnamed protein product [Vitrella brassicaformis CCMP3155]|uniref:Uncharacterized protein n=3 Tax=Vitrella brassicaformis TaxID=1169539 RepID=A0A0G4EHF1_VITBC|nr:unnamed protein product [Vitrella brassicaformis CCMP3155]|eukprot:CEL95321.1 unnamed protein product [Vitrella brassicaformis CCMP3155]
MSGQAECMLHYFAREGYWRKIQEVCNEELSQGTRDEASFIFWRALGMAKEGSVNEALRECDVIVHRREVALPATAALLYYHKQAQKVDRALLMAALFNAYTEQFGDARQYVQRVLDSVPTSVAHATKGWVEYLAGKSQGGFSSSKTVGPVIEKCEAAFNAAAAHEGGKQNVDALMGRVKVAEAKRQWQQFEWFVPGLIEKAKVLMQTADWEQAMETAQRITQLEADNIETLRLSILYSLAVEARKSTAAQQLQQLVQCLQTQEPRNPALWLSCSQLFARLACRDRSIINVTVSMLRRAMEMLGGRVTSVYLTELGYQQLLMGQINDAAQAYHQAIEKDNSDVRPLLGILHCRIEEGNLTEAEEQLDFLHEIQGSVCKSAELALMTALIAWRKRHDSEAAVKHLNDALTLHITTFRAASGYEFFIKLNADFMLEIAREYLQQTATATAASTVPQQQQQTAAPGAGGEKPSQSLSRGIKVLETLTRFVPGLIPAQILLAKARIALKDNDAAQRILLQCLKLDAANADGYLLLAKLYHQQDQPTLALQYLEKGLSHDFTVRQQPIFHLLKAQVHSSAGDDEQAIRILEEAMQLPGIKTVGAAPTSGQGHTRTGGSSTNIPLSTADRGTIFVMLAELLTKADRVADANRVIQDAIAEFAGTPEEVRILVTNAELAVKRGEVDQALNMLKAMQPTSPHFATAKMAMGSIYLKHRKDKRQYVRCYTDLIKHQPTLANYLALGEALMAIQEPSDAITAFQQALEKSPSDTTLIKRIGNALVQTHDYDRAVKYYKDALQRDPSRTELRNDLASFYLKLKKWDPAVTELQTARTKAAEEGKSSPASLQAQRSHIQTLMHLSKVHQAKADALAPGATQQSPTGDAPQPNAAVPAAVHALQEAREQIGQALANVPSVDEETTRALKTEAAHINFQLGEYFRERDRRLDVAIGYYHDALKHDDTYPQCYLALAKLHFSKGELDQGEKQLATLLRIDPANEEASVMMADLMMTLAGQGGRQGDGGAQEYKDALFYYQSLLESKPDQYAALSKLVFLLRRAGRLKDAPKYLANAEKACATTKDPEEEPGLRYCRGIHYRWTFKAQQALEEFNYARRDPDYREECLRNMVEIYLRGDEGGGLDQLENADLAVNAETVKEVEGLLAELQQCAKSTRDMRIQIYQAEVLMATRQKSQIERALQQLLQLLTYNRYRDYVPALLAMSNGLIMQKQHNKARNQLKRITELAKKAYNPEFAEEFEKAWLLLADLHIQQGKHEWAADLCRKAKDHNRSCGKAYEQLGLIYEKEAAFKDAAAHYEQAWELSNENAPTVGYRLAFNYLKAKRHVEAISVCQKVLRLNENYPRIKKEVMDKARAALRN